MRTVCFTADAAAMDGIRIQDWWYLRNVNYFFITNYQQLLIFMQRSFYIWDLVETDKELQRVRTRWLNRGKEAVCSLNKKIHCTVRAIRTTKNKKSIDSQKKRLAPLAKRSTCSKSKKSTAFKYSTTQENLINTIYTNVYLAGDVLTTNLTKSTVIWVKCVIRQVSWARLAPKSRQRRKRKGEEKVRGRRKEEKRKKQWLHS